MQVGVVEERLKRVFLGEWEEYVGWLTGVEEGPEGWVAVFDHTAVALPGEVDGLRQLIGKRVGILRTDDSGNPIRVRVIPNSSS